MNGVVMVFFGSLASLDLVWSLGDLFMGSITLCNLVAIVKLSPQACFLLNDYRQQKRNGIKSPVFHRSQMPDIEKDIEAW
jgi:AGCS family alanine or glycine:cation symporter